MDEIIAKIERLIPDLSAYTLADYVEDAIDELTGMYYQTFTVSGTTISPTPTADEKEIIALTAGRRILEIKKQKATQMAAIVSNVAGKSDLRQVAYELGKDIIRFSKRVNDKIGLASKRQVMKSTQIDQVSHSED